MNEVKKQVTASDVHIDKGILYFNVEEKKYTVELKQISERLRDASATEINLYQVSPSGYGIHWPLLDEDISFKGLIAKSTG